MLTEKTVRADDRRALFVGADPYKAAGGLILRDLFDEDGGGWLQDIPLLERLVAEKLSAEAEKIKGEGWGWVKAAVDFPWNHQRAYRRLKPIAPALGEEEADEFEALTAEFEELDSTPEDELNAEAKVRRAQGQNRLNERASLTDACKGNGQGTMRHEPVSPVGSSFVRAA